MAKASQLLLRVALAFAFAYPAYGFWTSPNNWVGYIPAFVKSYGLSQEVLVMTLAGFQLVLALWLLSGWRIFIPSLIAAVFFGAIVYFNQNQFLVLFRDVSLALAALALAFSARGRS